MENQQNNIVPAGQNFYCKIIFKDKYEYNSLNVISIVIREYVYEILPKIELILKYEPAMFEQFPIEDNDIFSIFLANSSDNENVFKIDCIVHDYKISVDGDDRSNIIQITAILKCKNMFTLKTKSYNNKTSFQVLQDIASDVGLIIKNPLNVIPNDKMTWYQLNQNNYDFIKHVMKRIYIHNDGVFFYGNHKGEFNYTSFNKERDKKEYKIAKFSVENYSKLEPEEKDTTVWYNSYEIINLQGTFNKESNYGVKNEYYNLISENSVIYSNINSMADLSFVDKDYYGKIVLNYYGGIYNSRTMYNEKYFESYIRNYFIKNNLLGFSIELNINSTIDVNLFDVIMLDINSKITKDTDRVYSGEYLITGITYFVGLNGIFQKRIFLSRNGINKPNSQNFIPRNF